MIEELKGEYVEGRCDTAYTLLRDGDDATARSVISTVLTKGQLSRAIHSVTHKATSKRMWMIMKNNFAR